MDDLESASFRKKKAWYSQTLLLYYQWQIIWTHLIVDQGILLYDDAVDKNFWFLMFQDTKTDSSCFHPFH